MKNQRKLGIFIALACLAMISLSSCGRGYGCPYDFSVAEEKGSLLMNFFYSLGSLL